MFKTELPEDKPTWQVGCNKCATLEAQVRVLSEALMDLKKYFEVAKQYAARNDDQKGLMELKLVIIDQAIAQIKEKQ